MFFRTNESVNTIHLVLVNGAKYRGTIEDLKKYLKNAYQQAVVSWDVVLEAKSLNVKDWDIDDDGKLKIETSILQRYSDEENTFITAWETANAASDPKAAYLFIVDMPNSLDARGYMPLNANYGFIFVGGENSSVHDEIYQNTIAHELGHGIFKLYHPWDTYGTSERQTDNLMDYLMGATLWKPQWDWIHDPGIRTYMFQKEGDGALVKDCFVSATNRNIYNQILKVQLSKIQRFGQVYEYVDGCKEITYCVGELTTEDKLRYLTEGKKVPYGEASPFVVELTKKTGAGTLKFNPSKTGYKDIMGLNPMTIFHEFTHAAQYIYDFKNGTKYYSSEDIGRSEVEVRVLLLYTYYQMAPPILRNDLGYFKRYLEIQAGSNYTTLNPLLGDFGKYTFSTKELNDKYLGKIDAIWAVIHSYFEMRNKGENKEALEYNVFLHEYAIWLWNFGGYNTFNKASFENYNGSTPFFNYITK